MRYKNTYMKYKRGRFPFALKCVLLFFFLFDIYFSEAFGLPTWFTSRRLSLILMLIVAISNGKFRVISQIVTSQKSVVNIIMLHVFLLSYSVVILLIAGWGIGEHILIHIIKFLIIAIFGAEVFCNFFDNLDEMFKALVVVTTIQAIFIISFLFFGPIQQVIDNFIGMGDIYLKFRSSGYATGIACVAAMGVLRMTPGIAACIYYILYDKAHSGKWIILFSFLALSAIMLARTGLIIVGLGLFVLLNRARKESGRLFVKIICGLLMLSLLTICSIYFFNLEDKILIFLSRTIRLLNKGLGDDFFITYFGKGTNSSTVFPELTWKIFLGTGIMRGTSGNGVQIHADGGYICLLVGYGIPIALFFYVFMFKNMYRSLERLENKNFKTVMFFMLVYIFIGEAKEFFIYDNFAISIFFSLLLLYDKDKYLTRENTREGFY